VAGNWNKARSASTRDNPWAAVGVKPLQVFRHRAPRRRLLAGRTRRMTTAPFFVLLKGGESRAAADHFSSFRRQSSGQTPNPPSCSRCLFRSPRWGQFVSAEQSRRCSNTSPIRTGPLWATTTPNQDWQPAWMKLIRYRVFPASRSLNRFHR